MSTVPPFAEVSCDSGNEYDGRLGIRVSSIFVIGFGSMLGALLPIALARSKRMHVPPVAFFIAKYFGSGVIIATAFIHLFAPATEALQSPCLTGPITEYSWAEGIALMTIFTMFFIELLASRYDVFGSHEHESADPAVNLLRDTEKYGSSQGTLKTPNSAGHDHSGNGESASSTVNNVNLGDGVSRVVTNGGVPGREDDFSCPPGGEDHLGHTRSHSEKDENFAAQMTGLFILEFGVIFHSIFIGLTLAVAGSEFNILYIVLSFHQTFEGLGLGSRLATASWPKGKNWLPWAMGAAFGLTTPIAIAIGLGVRSRFEPGSASTLIVQGVFDSISAGILIYTGLVELMAHEFMFNPEMRKSSIKMMLFAYGCMVLGAGLMAVLGRWA
ncbi:probable ZRT2-Zinc transporter II [Rhynchosporium secalis]|uniref:Probable ZRT2-Zinc transporter II n=1 Tax=Rhynchosporium secalis TaxID=38038 RepID=A0A1E1LV97_RHYSE|nr:probable ZRT2-Zinc transporter II [Rhynchosporium secalis]